MTIARHEAGYELFERAFALNRGRLKMSAGNWLELEAVLSRAVDGFVRTAAERLLANIGLVIEPVSIVQAEAARAAYRFYGRGRDHPAKLNFGDCFAYALAKVSGEPLLYKGNDFVNTDIVSAL